MSRKRINVPYRRERCVLSDTLPYEVPLTFTNRYFYAFLQANRIEYLNGKISWKDESDTLDVIIGILFGLTEVSKRLSSESRRVGPNAVSFKIYDLFDNAKEKRPSSPKGLVPFGYKIDHKQNEFRELTVPHPRNQLQIVEFYDRCKETILYFCSRSNFSIRRPHKIARCTYHRDRAHYEHLADDEAVIEQQDQEYEHLKSFFVYKDYSNVHKFYESYRYHRCEKKYNALLKLDISKCFDSVYTHSIVWAIMGKEAVKENLAHSKDTFAGQFDRLMQRMNHDETNGIIIGPEFSRLFAELILQSIDKRVEKLLGEAPRKICHKVHYEICRYVDDYFIFFNDEQHKDMIEEVLQHSLKEYGLYLNAAKAVMYEKPIITEITRAKRQIANLLEEKLTYRLEDAPYGEEPGETVLKGAIYVDSKALIIQFKTIIKTCDVDYKDVLNYSLSVVENKCDKILKNYRKADSGHRSERQLVNAVIAVLEFVFFIYAVSPRVNTTIKLCRILCMVCAFFKSRAISKEHKHLVFKYMFDDICLVLRKNKSDAYTQVETLYLLIALSELGKEYWLAEDVLASYLNINLRNESGEYDECSSLNYFSITVVLFYMRDKVRYRNLRRCIEKSILAKFRERSVTLQKEAEFVFLLLDVIACPYVSEETKRELLDGYEVADRELQGRIIDFKSQDGSRQQWFTTWHNFNFGKELDRKKGFEVY